MAFKFLDTTRATASEIISDTKTYIGRVYNRAGTLLTTASPFSQIIEVLGEMSSLIMYYVENATVEQNIYTAQHPESIYGLSRLVGHDPTRGFSAVGEIKFSWAAGVDTSKIIGDAINIPVNTQIQFEANGLKYLVRASKDQFRLEKGNSAFITASVIQGVVENQSVTSDGTKMQSFNLQTAGMTDHNLVTVSVNGQAWTKFDSMYDMLPTDMGYMIKTGISGGLDIYFGTGNFGMIPPNGSEIGIEYIRHDGEKGNLQDAYDLTFKWVGEGTDASGNLYDLNEFLQGECTSAPKMGANRESTDFTKVMAPRSSKSFVLASPDNYEYFLSRYGIFSYIDAYNTTDDGYLDDDNVIYIFAVPDLKKKLAKNQDYFSVPINEFFFDQNEYAAMHNVLQESGQQMVTTEVKFVEPKPVHYSMDISIRYFEGFRKEDVFNEIRAVVSDYLLNVTRRDKLPKSDIVYILEEVEGVDAVNVKFISKIEEESRRNGYYESTTTTVVPQQPIALEDIGNGKQKYVFFKKIVTTTQVNITDSDPIPADVIGLDQYGDIILDKDEIAVFRGGWLDRDGNTVLDEPSINADAALTVTFDETPVPRTIYTRLQAGDRRSIIRN